MPEFNPTQYAVPLFVVAVLADHLPQMMMAAIPDREPDHAIN